MPELPEVETTVRGLARFLEGERIVSVRVNRPDMRRPFPPDLVQAMTGATVSSLSRRAKYGLIHTDRDHALVFHLGMSGRWRIDPEDIGAHAHLVMETESGHRLSLFDPRRFGVHAEGVAQHHRRRKDCRHRVRLALARNIRRAAVDGFIHAETAKFGFARARSRSVAIMCTFSTVW